ncbi:MAG: discoidin domain-containing protein, partial [Kiritimatiellia bacterium]
GVLTFSRPFAILSFYRKQGSPSTNAVISYSQDNETWTDILTAETALYSSVHADVTLDTPVTARYWRLSVSSATQLGGGSCPNIRLGYVTPGIVFTNPPAAGAAIEMDCKLDRPIKNENWVLDFSFAVQFERS